VDLAGGTRTISLINSATFAGVISNGALSLLASSNNQGLNLANTNTYTGTTTVTRGVLRPRVAGALPVNTTLVMNSQGLEEWDTATLDLSQLPEAGAAVGSLAGTASSFVDLGTKTLTVGGNNTSTTFAGAITNTGSLVKTGSGSLTLTGPNTYSGATTVQAGTLVVVRTNLTATIGPSTMALAFSNQTPGTYPVLYGGSLPGVSSGPVSASGLANGQTATWDSTGGNVTVSSIPPAGETIGDFLPPGEPTNAAQVGKYLIGGATNFTSASEAPVLTANSSVLVLSAIIRTNDAGYSSNQVVGQWVTQLPQFSSLAPGSNEVVGTASANQTNVPAGFERRDFTVNRSNGPTRLFLRLKAVLE